MNTEEIQDLSGDDTDSASETNEIPDFGSMGEVSSEIYNNIVSDLEKQYAREHPGAIRHHCRICNAYFTNVKEKREHMGSHHPTIKFWCCKYCDFKTNHPKSLAAHDRKAHNGQIQAEAYRTCPGCQKHFIGFNLNRHVDKEHPNIFLFVCDECDFKTNYGQPMAVHTSNCH